MVASVPDVAPMRTSDGSFIELEVLPVGPERAMRWVDRLAESNFGAEIFYVVRSVAGWRGWVVRAAIDRVDGPAEQACRVRVSGLRDAETIVATIGDMVRHGDDIDEVVAYLHQVARQ